MVSFWGRSNCLGASWGITLEAPGYRGTKCLRQNYTFYAHRVDSEQVHPLTTFRPANEDHAVVNVSFQLRLDEFVEPATLQAAATADTRWRESLPAVQPLSPVSHVLDGQSLELPVLQCAVVRPDARPIWTLRFAGFEVIVECFAYTRWQRVWEQAQSYLQEAYELVRKYQADANILEVRLEVVDLFHSQAASYQATNLFQPNTEIANRLLDQGGAWHANSGWFESTADMRRLAQLKVNVRGQPSGDATEPSPYSFTIAHAQNASRLPLQPIPWESVPAIVNDLHMRNKALLLRLLQPEVLSRIGMTA